MHRTGEASKVMIPTGESRIRKIGELEHKSDLTQMTFRTRDIM